MQIHAFNTGIIQVKENYRAAPGGNRLFRLSSIVADLRFRPIPVFVWVIEHPEGVIVVDTGLCAAMQDSAYFPRVQRPYWQSQYRFHVQPEEEIGPRLRSVGIAPGDVRWVVLTHTHFDHTGGLHHFPHANVLFTAREYRDAMALRSAHFALPEKWPGSLVPYEVAFGPSSLGAFSQSHTLTRAGDVHVVPTPGHTPGHQSVIVQTDDMLCFLGGDTSFDQAALVENLVDAPTVNRFLWQDTRQRILDYARSAPLVYLTTHDFETESRLAQRSVLTPFARVAV